MRELSWIFVPLLTFSPWYKGCDYLFKQQTVNFTFFLGFFLKAMSPMIPGERVPRRQVMFQNAFFGLLGSRPLFLI